VFIVALTGALLMNYVVEPHMGLLHPVGYDGHFELAQNIAAGNGYVFEKGGHAVFHRPPFYASILVPGALLPESLWRLYVSILNAALLAGTTYFISKFCAEIFDKRVAAIASLATGLNPIILYTVKTAHPAICQMFLFTLVLFFTWRLWQRFESGASLGIGRAAGFAAALLAAALTHGTMILQAAGYILFFAFLAVRHRNWNLGRFALATAVFFWILLAPWTYRNYKVTGMFIPVVGNSGLAYFSGNAHWGITQPAWRWNEGRHEAELRHAGLNPTNATKRVQFYGFTNVQDEKFANAQMKAHLRAHPADFAKKFCLNAAEYYFPLLYYVIPPAGSAPAQFPFIQRIKRMEEKMFILITIWNAVLLALAMRGAALLIYRRGTRTLGVILLAGWAAYAVPYFPFLTVINHTLYTFGTMPILSVLAGIGIVSLGNCDWKTAVQIKKVSNESQPISLPIRA
jgi:hypothetical protein